MFIPQSPTAADMLFKSVPAFLENLDMIASHIAQPAVSGEPTPPMTFGIYGAWGAGKSTALRRLHGLVAEKLVDAEGVVTTSRYSAPAWQRTANPQASLAYTILNVLDPDAVFRVLRDRVDTVVTDHDIGPSEFVRAAEAFGASPAIHEQWMASISRILGPSSADGADRRHVHVVFVDDVDRCSKAFTAELLAATTYWDTPGQVNIFFVVAASHAHLLAALDENLELGPHTADQALEKYVHLAVTVPEMLTSPAEVARYLVALTDSIRAPWLTPEHIAALKRVLEESVHAYPDCTLAPLLQTNDGLTPRAVKNRFNTFLAEFRPQQHLDPNDIKQWVLKAFWPQFWWRVLWPLGRGAVPDERRTNDYVLRLRAYGSTLLPLWDLGDEELQPALAFLAGRDGIELRHAGPALAMYLAADPPWRPPGGATDARLLLDPSTSASPEPVAEAGAAENDLLLKHLEADHHLERGNTGEALRRLQEIAERAKQGGLPARAAGTVGNAALTAERMDAVPIARELHLAARQINPDHSNVMQNLIEFIVDAGQTDLYPLAETLIARLESDRPTFKPERTLRLRIQVDRALGRPLDPEAVERLLRAVEESPTTDRLMQLMYLGPRVVPVARVRRAALEVASNVATDDDLLSVLRVVADFLADSDEAAHECEAIALYEFLLKSGLACRRDPSEAFAVWFNLANLYRAREFPHTAAGIWWRLYNWRSEDPRLRRALAVVLDSFGYDAAAAAALVGQVLPPVPLDAEPAAERLTDDVARWWLDLKIGDYPPCEIPVAPRDESGERDGETFAP